MNRRTALRTLCSGALLMAGAGRSWPEDRRIRPDLTSALIVIDVQNCFVKGGTLAVEHGEDVVPVINRLASAFPNVILTQDWHTPGHASFASSHPGKKPYDSMQLAYGNQSLWPDHCVQGTPDAALDSSLHIPQAQLILRKGYHQDVDSYSAFREADRRPTGLEDYLKQRSIKRLFLTGLATDYCVAWTAIDAREAGFSAYVVEDACRGIDLKGSLAAAWKNMLAHGVVRIRSSDIEIA